MATPLLAQAAEIHMGGGGDNYAVPDHVDVYQPYEVDQILLPDYSQCLAVKTFLRMCGIDYTKNPRHNAEQMCPSGGLPFIKCGPQIVSEFDPIVDFVALKGLSLSEDLSGAQKSELKAYMALTINRLKLAELYVTWQDMHSSEAIAKPRYGSPYPWPLQVLLPWMKQREMKRYLQVQEWADKTVEQVHAEVNLCCKALSDKLGDQYYFFLDRPTELDALVYGHLNSLLKTNFTSVHLGDDVQRYPNLVRFCDRITERYFPSGTEEER